MSVLTWRQILKSEFNKFDNAYNDGQCLSSGAEFALHET